MATPPAFSLSGSGALRSLFRATRLERGNRSDVLREALALGVLTWMPLAAIAVVEWLAHGHIEPVLRDPAVHARLLIAIPLFLVAETLLGQRCVQVVARLSANALVERGTLSTLAHSAEALVRSKAIEGVLAALALGLGQFLFWDIVATTGAFTGAQVRGGGHGPARIWYSWIAFPIFLFCLARVLFRWVVWARFLWQLSRAPIRAEPTHPDRAGGVQFLSGPIIAMAVVALANTSVLAASWTGALLGGADSSAYTEPFALWLSVALLLAFAPLFPFAGWLYRLRRRGLQEFGDLALAHSRLFRQRWFEKEPGPELLGSPDIQSLADLAGGHRIIRRMLLLPCGLRDLITVLVAVVLPMIPLLLTQVPVSKLVLKVLHAVVGR